VTTLPLVAVSPLADLLSLVKFRLSLLVLATAGGGMWLAGGGLVPRHLVSLMGMLAAIAGANAVNCVIERDVDALMQRTRNRPVAAGRMSPALALRIGFGLAGCGVLCLAASANLLTAALAATAFVVYVCVYTPAKRVTPWALLVGTVPGAIPPLMGWTAVTGRADGPAWALFAILVLWQLPHFLALSLLLQDDYRRAGMPVFALRFGAATTRLVISLSTTLLAAACLVPSALGVTSHAYGLAAGALCLAYLAASLWERAGARPLFLGSLGLLSGLLLALMLGAQ
jgi:protoheme IX farnesyltransferase